MVASPDNTDSVLPKWGLLLKEEVAPTGANFIPLRVDSHPWIKGGKYKSNRNPLSASVSVKVQYCVQKMQTE